MITARGCKPQQADDNSNILNGPWSELTRTTKKYTSITITQAKGSESLECNNEPCYF